MSRVRSLLDRYRGRGARALLDRARGTVAELLEPRRPPRHRIASPQSPPSPPPPRTADVPPAEDPSRDDVLAGVCAGIALRDLNLLDSLLAELERMEAEEQDPDALARLYRLDHLATRLRRNAENLRVLAGEDAGAAAEDTASLVDVIRAAISAIERYPRVDVGRVVPLAVVGFAADDVSRLLTELLDNATAQSPPSSPVTVSAHVTENGSILLRVEDTGIGLPPERMAELNERLSTAPALDGAAIEHMGLAVVRRLSDKHGVRVWLGRRAPHGTTASVLLPAELVREAPPVSFERRPEPDVPTQAAPPGPAPSRPRTRPDDGPRPAVPAGGPSPTGPRTGGTNQTGPRTGGTTPGGLPRRVPASLRVPDGPADISLPPPLPSAPGADAGDGFFADLADFGAGEQAARGVLPEPDASLPDGPLPDALLLDDLLPDAPGPDDPGGRPSGSRPSDD